MLRGANSVTACSLANQCMDEIFRQPVDKDLHALSVIIGLIYTSRSSSNSQVYLVHFALNQAHRGHLLTYLKAVMPHFCQGLRPAFNQVKVQPLK